VLVFDREEEERMSSSKPKKSKRPREKRDEETEHETERETPEEKRRLEYLKQLRAQKEREEEEQHKMAADEADVSLETPEEPPCAQLPDEEDKQYEVLDVDQVMNGATEESEKKVAAEQEEEKEQAEPRESADMPLQLSEDEIHELPTLNENGLMVNNPNYFAKLPVSQDMFEKFKYKNRQGVTVSCPRLKGTDDSWKLFRWSPLVALRYPFLGPMGNWSLATANANRKYTEPDPVKAEYFASLNEYGWNKKLLKPEDEDLDPELTRFFDELERTYHEAAVFIVRNPDVLAHKEKILKECTAKAMDRAQARHQERLSEKRRIENKLKLNPAFPLDDVDKERLKYPDVMGSVPEELVVEELKNIGSSSIRVVSRTATNQPVRRVNIHGKVFAPLSEKQIEAAKKERKMQEDSNRIRRAAVPEAHQKFDRLIQVAKASNFRYVELKVENCDRCLVPRHKQDVPDGTVAWVCFTCNFYVESPSEKIQWGMRVEPVVVRVYRQGKGFRDMYEQIRAKEPVFKKPKFAQDIFQHSQLEDSPAADDIDVDILTESGDGGFVPNLVFTKQLMITQ